MIKRIFFVDSIDEQALIGIANTRILLATGYTSTMGEKEEHYQNIYFLREAKALVDSINEIF